MTKSWGKLTPRRRTAAKKHAMFLSAPVRLRVILAACCLVMWLCIPAISWAQSESAPEDKALREKWQAVYARIAGSIDMRRGDAALKLEPAPLLFYTNPVRLNQQHGSIFLWTEGGRPAVFGSIWSALNRNDASVRFVTHEFHSLATTPDVSAVKNGAKLWAASESGL